MDHTTPLIQGFTNPDEMIDFTTPALQAIYAAESRDTRRVESSLRNLDDLLNNLDTLLDEMEQDNVDIHDTMAEANQILDHANECVVEMDKFMATKLNLQQQSNNNNNNNNNDNNKPQMCSEPKSE